jgi:hypothetical protein
MANSELIREGCKSYHQALFAVMQFRRQVQDTIHNVVENRNGELASALKLDVSQIELAGWADPENYRQKFDGSQAEVGLKMPGNPWSARWGLYFGLWVGDEERSYFYADVWLKQPGDAIEKLASWCPDLDCSENTALLYEYLPAHGPVDLTAIANRVLDRWIALWKKAGGLAQFLAKARAHAAG